MEQNRRYCKCANQRRQFGMADCSFYLVLPVRIPDRESKAAALKWTTDRVQRIGVVQVGPEHTFRQGCRRRGREESHPTAGMPVHEGRPGCAAGMPTQYPDGFAAVADRKHEYAGIVIGPPDTSCHQELQDHLANRDVFCTLLELADRGWLRGTTIAPAAPRAAVRAATHRVRRGPSERRFEDWCARASRRPRIRDIVRHRRLQPQTGLPALDRR